jgi:hypothetical protein
MEMFHQASMKLGLDRAVLAHARIEQDEENQNNAKGKGGGGVSSTDPGKLNVKEIDELLKRGAYHVFREDDTEQNEFVEADIDAIMQRRSHKVVYDEGMSSIKSTLGNFSKASFVSADDKEDVDINDPDFWKKAVGLKEENDGELADPDENELLPQQRVRKQTKVYGNELRLDEAQLKLYLKPLKAKIEKTQTQKEMQKEAAAKERIAREEAKKVKQAEEMKQKADPKHWGPHTRDRVLRALNLYGFGRFERIKNETAKGMMETKDLESFCRFYVLQCGLCACEFDTQKSDTPYLTEAIQAARDIEQRIKNGEIIEFPPTLTDPKFITKLRSGQAARKLLNKLDTLSKLQNILQIGIENAFKAKNMEYSNETDLDTLFNTLTIEEIATHLPIGDVRPSWARTCSWWNLDCDKHLLIGIFKHGFGRYDAVRDDENLLFKKKLQELTETYAAAVAKDEEHLQDFHNGEALLRNAASPSNTSDGGLMMKMDVSADNNEDSKDGVGSVTNTSIPHNESKTTLDEMVPPSHNGDFLNGTQKGDEDKSEDEDALDDDEMGTSMKPTNGIGLPDPRHLNRLIAWLVSNEMARMTELDVGEKKKERKSRNSANAAGGEAAKKTPVTSAASLKPAYVDNGSINVDRESSLFGALRDSFDLDTISLVYKAQIQGLKKCEQFLALSVPLDTPVEAENSIKAPTTTSTTTTNENDNLKSPMSTDETKPGSPGKESTPPVSSISEFESIRLCATLILYGAPLYTVENITDLLDKYLPKLGIPLIADINGESEKKQKEHLNYNKVFSWSDILHISGLVKLSEKDCENFYQDIWLKFCESIIKTKMLSYAQNKFVVPNPLLETSDHHFAAKGLCQIFAIREQLLYATYFILTNCEEMLFDYLRSSTGRNVDNMPVWWCPWIHDVGLLMGLLKYGFLSLENIFDDNDLPFHKTYLERFVRKVFLTGRPPQQHSQPQQQLQETHNGGSTSTHTTPTQQNHPAASSTSASSADASPVGKYDISSQDDAEKFLKIALQEYPESKDLELRIIKILEEMTKFLPDQHACRVVMSHHMFRYLLIQHGSLTDFDSASGGQTIGGGDGGKSKSSEQNQLKNMNRSSTARPPAVSLKTFLNTSYRRRKHYVESYHPELQQESHDQSNSSSAPMDI